MQSEHTIIITDHAKERWLERFNYKNHPLEYYLNNSKTVGKSVRKHIKKNSKYFGNNRNRDSKYSYLINKAANCIFVAVITKKETTVITVFKYR